MMAVPRNLANSPVDDGRISHYLQDFSTIQTVVGNGNSEPSTVCCCSRFLFGGERCKLVWDAWLVSS